MKHARSMFSALFSGMFSGMFPGMFSGMFSGMLAALLVTAGWPQLAAGHGDGHDDVHIAVPSPDCIQTILDTDTGVQADDCLVALASIMSRDGSTHDGMLYPIAELQTDRYSMMIHYTGGAFPDAALRNWPLSIDLNFGGSGWFSYLLVLVETRAGKVASGFVRQAGDRCNDGYARWDGFSENGNGTYVRSATPFRLVNPLDETNWRGVENAMLFEGKDETAKRAEMLTLADPPLYQSWLPYQDLENCASCCVGEIVIMQNMIGTEVDPGRDYGVLGVILHPQQIASLAGSDKIGDRCLAAGIEAGIKAGLDAVTGMAEPSGPDGKSLFLYRDSWLKIRDGLAAACPD